MKHQNGKSFIVQPPLPLYALLLVPHPIALARRMNVICTVYEPNTATHLAKKTTYCTPFSCTSMNTGDCTCAMALHVFLKQS